MAYNKNDAYKALNNLKEDYIGANDLLEESRKNKEDRMKDSENLFYAKRGARRIGLFFTTIFALGMLSGFASIIPFVIFASLAGVTLLGTIGVQIYYSILQKVNNQLIKEVDVLAEEVQNIMPMLTSYVDDLQDVVHLNRPINNNHEEIIQSWINKSVKKDVEDTPQREDDIELFR